MLSLPALPPPPQLDQNYTRQDQIRRLRDREGETTPAMPQHQDGWLVIGAGEEYEDVHVGATSSSEDSSLVDSERIEVTVPGRPSVPRSTNSSTTTFSQPSSSPSIDIQVESTPSFDPIDVGDEGRPEEAGQRDRLNGKVDAVFKLHSSRRMKPTSSGRGVSIPSRMSETEINADARTPVVQVYEPIVFESSPAVIPYSWSFTSTRQVSNCVVTSDDRMAQAYRVVTLGSGRLGL